MSMASGVMTPGVFSGSWFIPLGCAARTGSITCSSSLFGGNREALSEVTGGVEPRQPMTLGPQVQDVTLGTAGRVEALEDVLMKVDREAAAGRICAAVDR